MVGGESIRGFLAFSGYNCICRCRFSFRNHWAYSFEVGVSEENGRFKERRYNVTGTKQGHGHWIRGTGA